MGNLLSKMDLAQKESTLKSIGCIGGGNMGKGMMLGLKRSHPHISLLLSDPGMPSYTEKELETVRHVGLQEMQEVDLIIIAIKPQIYSQQWTHIAEMLKESKAIILSVMPGINLKSLQEELGAEKAIIRTMPNLAVSLQEGIIGWSPGEGVSREQEELISTTLEPLGLSLRVKEEELDLITLIAGCGPGYVAEIIAQLQAIAQDYGLQEGTARALVQQMIAGTGKALKSVDPKEYALSVSSKGGVTEAIREGLIEEGSQEMLRRAIKRGESRLKEMQEG